MNYQCTIELGYTHKNIILKPALYMNAPLWEITMDDTNYIVRNTGNGWEQSCNSELDEETLKQIGLAIEGLELKEAG